MGGSIKDLENRPIFGYGSALTGFLTKKKSVVLFVYFSGTVIIYECKIGNKSYEHESGRKLFPKISDGPFKKASTLA